MSDVKLNFINRSNDVNNSEVVIFPKNVTTDSDEIAIAWTVIENCGQGDNHPFTYPMTNYMSASDSYGNITPQLKAEKGQLFHMSLESSGDVLSYVESADSPDEVVLRNDLSKGAINALIFKADKLFAKKTSIAPAQEAVFSFKPTIWIGAASQVEEGQVMNSAIISAINTEISLLGIASADIVMTGGGSGPGAEPFAFSLENVEMA